MSKTSLWHLYVPSTQYYLKNVIASIISSIKQKNNQPSLFRVSTNSEENPFEANKQVLLEKAKLSFINILTISFNNFTYSWLGVDQEVLSILRLFS